MRCPNCSDTEQQTPISVYLTCDVEVYSCDKCSTNYGLIIFDDKSEADEFIETYYGEIL